MSLWVPKREPYYVQTGSMYDNPYGVPHEEIEAFIADSDPATVAQVVFGKYVDNSGLVFLAELINQMVDRRLPKVNGNTYLDEAWLLQSRIEMEHSFDPYRFAHGVDLARKKDYTVITVLDVSVNPARLVYWKRINRAPWPSIYAEIGRALYLFPGEQLVDGTGAGGDVILEELQARLYCPKHHVAWDASFPCPQVSADCRKKWIRLNPDDFIFTTSSKVQLINHLQAVLGHGYQPDKPDVPFGRVRTPAIQQLNEELTAYVWDDKKLETDCVMSLALACHQGIHEVLYTPSHTSVHGD